MQKSILPLIHCPACEDARHLRRYTRRQLTSLLNGAKFQVLEICYYQFLLFPMVLVARLFVRRGPGWRDFEDLPFPALNTLMSWINVLEAKLGKIISRGPGVRHWLLSAGGGKYD